MIYGKLVRARVSDPAAAEPQLHLKGEFAEKFLGGNRAHAVKVKRIGRAD